MAKELKTSEELMALLIDGCVRIRKGPEVNPQWIDIVHVDPPQKGANWKVSYSGPTGPFADAIERVMRQLQNVYDLSPPEQ